MFSCKYTKILALALIATIALQKHSHAQALFIYPHQFKPIQSQKSPCALADPSLSLQAGELYLGSSAFCVELGGKAGIYRFDAAFSFEFAMSPDVMIHSEWTTVVLYFRSHYPPSMLREVDILESGGFYERDCDYVTKACQPRPPKKMLDLLQ